MLTRKAKKDVNKKFPDYDIDETRSCSDDAPKVAEAASAWRHLVDVMMTIVSYCYDLLIYHFIFLTGMEHNRKSTYKKASSGRQLTTSTTKSSAS